MIKNGHLPKLSDSSFLPPFIQSKWRGVRKFEALEAFRAHDAERDEEGERREHAVVRL